MRARLLETRLIHPPLTSRIRPPETAGCTRPAVGSRQQEWRERRLQETNQDVRWVDNEEASVANVVKTAIRVLTWSLSESCLHRILIDVGKGSQILANVVDDPALEPIVPDVATQIVDSVEFHGEHAQYPLHDSGKGSRADRMDDQVKMVVQAKRILGLCPHEGLLKQALHGMAVKDELSTIGPCHNMVARVWNDFSWLSHT